MSDKRKYVDRAEYLKKAVAKRRKNVKAMTVKYKGGKCVICGYDKSVEALDFHHIDEKKKKFGISGQGLTRALKDVQREADKCVLLCANCHRELHANIVQLPKRKLG